jgi:mitochondrial enoyl-[acyl-carrier protein] reductase / trans-2-enoyl-CoA reductase
MWNTLRVAARKQRVPATRFFSSSSARQANRSVVYEKPGDPQSALFVHTYGDLPPPPAGSINVRFLLSPINPADINVIEGVYPDKPTRKAVGTEGKPLYAFIGGNEGLAEITEVGSGVEGLQEGDRVVMMKPQVGTWTAANTLKAEDVIKLPPGASEVTGATIAVSPLF